MDEADFKFRVNKNIIDDIERKLRTDESELSKLEGSALEKGHCVG